MTRTPPLPQPRQLGTRVQLDHALPDLELEDIETLRALLVQHGVICLPGQSVTPRQLQDFAGRWGEVIGLPAGLRFSNPEPGLPSIARVGNVRADGGIIEGARFAEYWHHDGDFWPSGNNFVINFLSCRLVPEAGGNTGFLDMQIAYQELSPERRRELEGAYIEVRPSEISDFQMAPADELPPNVVHSVLQPHPLSGKIALYLPDSRSGIQAADGHFIQAVAEALADLQAEQAVYQHRWSPGDLLIIDNLQVMHRSMGGFGDSPRLLYRCQSRLPMGKGWSPN